MRRRPEESVLHQVALAGLPGFLAERAERDRAVPRFTESALRAYLRCGLLEHGFCRLRCGGCGDEAVVAFSCKTRGFCPSCLGRRMNDTSARWVDEVLPAVPLRQWVLSLPPALRVLCAFKPSALSAFVRAVFAFQRRRARRLGLRGARCGGVTVVQRFGSACELNVHFHSLLLDGVYVVDPERGVLSFHVLPPPTARELGAVARSIARKVQTALGRRGFDLPEAVEDAAAAEPEAAALIAESLSFPSERRGDAAPARTSTAPEWVGKAAGFNLHAGVSVGALDLGARERLCRYLLRPPLSDERLALLPDGRVSLALKTPWRDGTTALVLTAQQLVARLAALVPRPFQNTVRYHGILAPNAAGRARVVPLASSEAAPERPPDVRRHTGRYLAWAELLRRVFEVEVLTCTRCGGRLRLVAVITASGSTGRYLRGLDGGAPHPARPPPG